MDRRLLIPAIVLILICLPLSDAYAQATGTITGTVVDSADGTPLPGVNVVVQDINAGAATGTKGQYAISDVPVGTHTVVVSFVGYERRTVPVEVSEGETTQLDVTLVSSAVGLDEVVVTSLGIEREERSLGYSVQEVSAAEIAESQETNLVGALAAKASGLQVTNSGGQPGSSSKIIIRGEASFQGDNQPLFVVDGVPISNAEDNLPGFALGSGSSSNRVLDLDPSVIENVSILKGASATALYGQRAADGVILIETKSGQEGRLRVNINSSVRWDEAILDGMQDEYLLGLDRKFSNGLPADRGGYTEPGFPGSDPQITDSWGPHKDNVSQQVLDDLGVDEIPTHNHMGNFYERGLVSENSINVSGGSSVGNYRLSGSYLNQEGTVPTTGLERINMSGKFNTDLTSNIQSNTSVQYAITQNDWQRNGWVSQTRVVRQWPINLPIEPVFREDGSQLTLGGTTDSPYWHVRETGFESEVDRFIGSQQVSIELTDWLEVSENLGYDRYTDSRHEHRNRRPRYDNDGSMFEERIVRSELNSDLMLNVNPIPLGGGISVSGVLGNNVNIRSNSRVRVSGSDQNIPDFFSETNFDQTNTFDYEQERRLISLFSEVEFNYQDYLYLTLTGRNDWSSTLPPDNSSFFYPSASLGLVFTDMLGMEDNSILNFGKLRLSVAEIGSDAPVYSLSTSYNQAGTSVWEEADERTLNFPFRGQTGFLLGSSLGNPNLKPEITTEYEVGLNLRMFGGRAQIDASYYDRSTRDQIFDVPASSATGYETILRNAGEIRNKGVEISVEGTPVELADFSWDLRANWSKNQNEVVELAPGVESIYLAGYAWPQVRVEPGEGYGIIWGNGYVRNDEGELLIGEDGMPIVDEQQKNIGNIQADWLGNLRSTFNYKGFSLTSVFDVRQGGDILNFDLNYTIPSGRAEITENRYDTYVWPGVDAETGEPNTTEVTRDQEFWEEYGSVHENQVEDGSYVKLRQLTLSYRLPSSIIETTPLRSLEIYGTGRNLWISTPFSYGDPEGSTYGTDNGGRGYYFWVTPSTRSYTIGLRMGL
jgi:TonB-linked SusC/RagA family outer membrane protein